MRGKQEDDLRLTLSNTHPRPPPWSPFPGIATVSPRAAERGSIALPVGHAGEVLGFHLRPACLWLPEVPGRLLSQFRPVLRVKWKGISSPPSPPIPFTPWSHTGWRDRSQSKAARQHCFPLGFFSHRSLSPSLALALARSFSRSPPDRLLQVHTSKQDVHLC